MREVEQIGSLGPGPVRPPAPCPNWRAFASRFPPSNARRSGIRGCPGRHRHRCRSSRSPISLPTGASVPDQRRPGELDLDPPAGGRIGLGDLTPVVFVLVPAISVAVHPKVYWRLLPARPGGRPWCCRHRCRTRRCRRDMCGGIVAEFLVIDIDQHVEVGRCRRARGIARRHPPARSGSGAVDPGVDRQRRGGRPTRRPLSRQSPACGGGTGHREVRSPALDVQRPGYWHRWPSSSGTLQVRVGLTVEGRLGVVVRPAASTACRRGGSSAHANGAGVVCRRSSRSCRRP